MTPLPPSPLKPATLELAPVGNCTVSALVDQGGSIVWCCMPRFDSPPVFDACCAVQRDCRWMAP